MAHKHLHFDIFVLVVCLVFQSLCNSFPLTSLDSPISSFHSLIPPNVAFNAQTVQPYECYPPDHDALLDLAASSSKKFLGVSKHWPRLREQDCCHWVGVTCGSPFNSTTPSTNNSSANPKMYTRVVGLTLQGSTTYSSTAMMSLPLAICRLSALVSLDLSRNALGGPIPNCFSLNLTSLHTLILSGNRLSGSLSPLANLSLLTHLDLSVNVLSGSLSPLANLSLLTHLDLSANPYISQVTSSIVISGNLSYMDLFSTGLSGALSDLKPHTPSRLEHLDLSENSLSGSTVSFIESLSTNLRYLDLSHNQLDISLTPAAFSTTPLVEHLDLSENDLVIGDIRVLEHLQHLQLLALEMLAPAHTLGSLFCNLGSLHSLLVYAEPNSDNIHAASTRSGGALNGALLCEKPVSVNLTSLYLAGQGYTGLFPMWIAHFARLEYLNLEDNQFEGSIPQAWQALTQLNSLSLSGDSLSHDVSLSQEVQSWLFRLPLESLALRSMGLTSQDFPCAGFSLLNHTLINLNLNDNHISPAGHSLLHCLQQHNFSHLFELDLSANPLALSLQPDMFPVSIKRLSLSYCQLSGNLSNIGTPSAAFLLDLSHNNLSGSIPSNIGRVTYLDLSHNKLTGIIPSSVCSSNNSIYYWRNLDSNHVHGELILPALMAVGVSIANNYLSKVYFHNVSYLEFLDLSNNQLGGTLESLLGDNSVLKSLTVLLLSNNHLEGSIPTSLGTSAPFLITMDLSNNKLTGALPPTLHYLQALQSKLSKIINDFLPYTLASVKNVEFNVTYYSRGHLDISSNQLNGSIPDGLGALVGLNDLNLSRNHLSGPIPPSLAHLAFLESLDLSFNNLEGVIPSEFSKLTSLEVFNVSFNPKLTGRIPEGTQLEIGTSYEGDHKLCGQAINKSCTSDQQISQEPDNTLHTLGFKERFACFVQGIEEWVAIPGIILGHVVGMGITFWVLKRLHFYK